MKKTKSLTAAFAILVSLGTLTACGNSGSSSNNTSSTPASTGTAASTTLAIGLDSDPPTLDPSLSSALIDRQVMFNLYDTLFQLTPSNQIAPDLVQSYTISNGGKTYTFQLRKGVTFQDGTPFNAAAVKFNILRDQQPSSARHSQLAVISSVDTPSTYTVVLHLKTPFSPLLATFTGRSGMMVSPTAVKKEGSNFASHPVGTGPFEFKDRVKGDHITLVKNPHYWGTEPKLDKVIYRVYTDQTVEVTNLQNGTIQMAEFDGVTGHTLDPIKGNSNFVVSNQPGLGYDGIYLNTTAKPFTNVYLREAVNEAINRTQLVNALLPGVAQPGYSPFSPASPVYNKQEDTPPTPNAATIKKLLTEGGKPSGFSFTLQIVASPSSDQMGQVIQSMLATYGIKVKLEQLEFGTLLANNEKHAFQASLLGWSGRLDPDQDVYPFFITGGFQNGSNYSNPQVDALLNQARSESSMAARAKTYAQMMNILHHDVPYVFLYHQNNVVAYSNKVQGFQPYSDGVVRVAGLSLS